MTNTNNTINMFDYQLSKGNLNEAINIAIIDAERTSEYAQEAVQRLDQIVETTSAKANSVLSKYQAL